VTISISDASIAVYIASRKGALSLPTDAGKPVLAMGSPVSIPSTVGPITAPVQATTMGQFIATNSAVKICLDQLCIAWVGLDWLCIAWDESTFADICCCWFTQLWGLRLYLFLHKIQRYFQLMQELVGQPGNQLGAAGKLASAETSLVNRNGRWLCPAV